MCSLARRMIDALMHLRITSWLPEGKPTYVPYLGRKPLNQTCGMRPNAPPLMLAFSGPRPKCLDL